MKKFLFFLLLLPYSLFAQYDLPLRLEIPTAKDAEDYSFQSLDSLGCAVIYEGNVLDQDSVAWLFMHYDTNLQKIKNAIVPLPHNLHFVTACTHHGILYALFQTNPQKKQTTKSYLASLNLKSYKSNCLEINNLSQDNIYRVTVVDSTLILRQADKDSESIFFFDLSEKRLSRLSLTNADIQSIEFIVPDTFREQKRLLCGLILKLEKYSTLSLIETDLQGNVLKESTFPDLDNGLYSSARMACVDSNTFLVIGTYSQIRKQAGNNMHSGVFTTRYSHSTFEKPNTYNYSQLNEANVNQETKNGGPDLEMIVGEIATNGKQFGLTAEVFYAEYENTVAGYYDFYNHYVPSTPTFIGYRYVNAYVTAFDTNGRLIWNQFLPFGDLLTQRLVDRVSLFFDQDYALIYYPYNYTITSMLVQGNTIIEPLNRMKLETNHPKDEIEYTKYLKMENWYGNNFIVSGYQYIKSGIKGSKSKKYVFFANKLKYY